MRAHALLVPALVAALLAACGDAGGPQRAQEDSGIEGRVLLGPRCPNQSVDEPCADEPAAGSEVTVAKQVPGSDAAGDVVARATTDAKGSFRVAVVPGDYVITADAGTACEPVTAHVTAASDAKVDVSCDTGIR